MALQIITLPLGPMGNNSYLIADQVSKDTIVVDPTFDFKHAIRMLQANGNKVIKVWFTHAHFDHVIGVKDLVDTYGNELEIALHPDDAQLYATSGGANEFGLEVPDYPPPNRWFKSGEVIDFHGNPIEVRHAPGHCRGHVVFYLPENKTLLSGDVIFNMGIGRSDLEGGDSIQLMKSIYDQVLSLPAETKILSGHGPSTTVGFERQNNPWIRHY